jgi:uncharacterized protein YggE
MAKTRVHTITVTGHGVVRLVPDVASVTIGVDIAHPALADAQSEATRAMRAVLDAVKEASVPSEDIQTAGYGVFVIRDWSKEGDPTESKGFRVWNQARVKVRQLDRLGSVLDTVAALGANTISAISFTIDDASAAESQARVLAVEDARRKADELASAVGLSVGRALSISEVSAELPYQRQVMYSRSVREESVPIEAGTEEVTVDLQLVYELR